MSEALFVLLGGEAKGLSANVVSRLKAQWSDEWQQWDRQVLSTTRYVGSNGINALFQSSSNVRD
jgi:putative transposase